ncbi:MAG: hypothetical protein P4L41_11530 [Flavipsychrobacter sp.]|nr:hypothetical protein [Flavipsychrobacter sp.]
MKVSKNLVCAIYNHPEAYPPTLNAIEQLSNIYDNIYVLYRPNLNNLWQYPSNVKLISSGKQIISVKAQACQSIFKKFYQFLNFTFILLKLHIKYKPKTILLYDGIPLLSHFIVSKLWRKPQIAWYHNHDVMGKDQRKYSVGWFATHFEGSALAKLDIFSLPSEERKVYFDLSHFTGKYFYIPNYPSLAFYDKFHKNVVNDGRLKLIYQGSISKGHGIEEIISFIATHEGETYLTLIGNVNDEYKEELIALIKQLNIDVKVKIQPPVNYALLPAITINHDIGLAIHTPHNLIYATGGTASNKIYEYAAVGLPVLYFGNEHYNQALSKYKWTFATDLSMSSIQNQIDYIRLNLDQLSVSALSDFNKDLNFESVFSQVINYLNSIRSI